MASEASAGAGGKFRKKPFRRTQATPYDRPPTALRPTQLVGAAAERENNGWLSKLVDPASRLITAGAQKLFSSVFRKRLLPPPPQPSLDETPEIVDKQPETTTNVGPSGNKEAVASKSNDPSRVSQSGGVADLEDILKQKTFTRSEIDHLTALLKSRTVDNLVRNEKGSSEPNSSDERAFHNGCEILTNYPANENGAECVLPAAITTPVTRSKVLEDVVASPAELAKAYMGSRPTRASPSMPRDGLSASYNPFFKQKSPSKSLIQKPANEIGAAANGFMTPRYRGRSAIYSMARTPYSRPHPTEVFKAAAETSYGAHGAHGASSSSHNATEIQQLSGSNRQVLKRRSSALESDIGFVGPIRRIRQKPNLLHYKALSQPVSGANHVRQGSGVLTDATEVPSSIDESANLRSSSKALVDNGMHSTRNKSVPSQSIETAQKIFQQLDKFSSKGKSPEKKFDIVGGSSSGKMTTDMRDELARKSMNTDSLKVLQSIEDSRKESGLVDSSNAPDHSLQILPRVEGSFHKSVPSVEEGAEAGRPTKVLDFKNPLSNYDHPQKKRAFQMSAHEDYLELDDDVHANGVASTPFVKGVEDHELAKNSAAISDNPQSVAISAGNPLAPALNSSTISSGKIKESPTAQKFSGFSVPIGFSTSSSTSTSTLGAVSYPLSTAEINNVAGQTEKLNDIIATSSNSAAAKDIKSELPSSATEDANEADGPDTVKKNILHFGDVSKKTEGDPSSVVSSAKGLFSFGTQSNGATLSNGLSSTLSVTMGVSSPVQISSSSNDQGTVPVSVSSSPSPSLSVSNGNVVSTFSSVTSAGTMFSTATTGGLPNFGSSSSQFSTSTSAPSVFGSSFQFGSPAVPSTSASALESVAGPKASETAFSNATGGLFSAKSIGIASVGNTISGFNASTSKSASGETQTAPPAIFSSASSSAVAFASSTPNFSTQSASSPSSSVFGFSAPASVNGSAPLSAGSNPFTSGAGFVSSVGFPSVTAPVSSSSNISSTIFGLQSSKPATSGSMFGSSSQFTGFNFGSTASGTSGASNSTPIMYEATSSSSSASVSVFGANSSSSAANSGVFSFGAGSSAASVFSVPSAAASTSAPSTPFSSQPAFASSTPQPFAFGLTPPAGNNDRMSMEDSMAEDSVQVSTPAAPVFGQPISAPSSSFVFNGAAAPSAGSPFQFSGQQNQFAPQNTPFQPSGSLEFNAGGAGSFSLGSGGVDKASRRIVKVKKQIRRK